MPKLRYLFAIFLLLGLIFAELLPSINKYQPTPANSQSQLASPEQNFILSILENNTPASSHGSSINQSFLDINFPLSPSEVGHDAQYISSLIYQPLTQNINPSSNDPLLSTDPDSILQNVLPPLSSALYYAYQDGGRAWYQTADSVLVIFEDETIRSFNKPTGEETDWLQQELAYSPIDDPDAITNYQTNYNARQVAETTTWILMEFPSGGVLKVARPGYAGVPTGGGTIYGLPDILPGYDNF